LAGLGLEAVEGFFALEGMEMEKAPARDDGRGVGIAAGDFEDEGESGAGKFFEEGAFGSGAVVGGAEEAGPVGGRCFFGQGFGCVMEGESGRGRLRVESSDQEKGEEDGFHGLRTG